MIIDFVNRSKELKVLNGFKQKLGTENSSVIIVNGVSGVGKSILTKRFITSFEKKVPTIKVEITQAEKSAYSTGFYINKIASALNEASKNNNYLYTFKQYIRLKKPSEIILNKIRDSIKADLASNIPGGNTITSIFNIALGQSEYDEKLLFTSTHSESHFLLTDYIISSIKMIPLVLNIENIQSIDNFSLQQLMRIIKESNSSIFLIEFTEDDNTGSTLSDIMNSLESNKIDCKILNVEPLNIVDVKQIIDKNPRVSWELIERSYVEWKGNLRPLVDFLTRLKYGININDDGDALNNGTISHLLSLPQNEIFLLHVIFWHKEATEINLLKRLLIFRDAFKLIFDIESTIGSLEEKCLIKISEGKVNLEHDSIAKEFEKLAEHQVFTLISHKFWLEVYNDLLKKNDVYISRGHILSKILYYSVFLNDLDRIYELLKLINYEALRSREPEKMITYVERIKENAIKQDIGTDSRRIRHINLWLIELYYKLGNAKQAWNVLNEIKDNTNTEIVLKAILLEQIGKHQEAIKFCKNQIRKATNTNMELALSLVYLVTNYDLGNEKIAKKEFSKLIKNEKYINCIEYGFLLRNAELVFSFKKSLPYYKKSIDVFLNHNAIRQAAFSRITYGVHLGLTGQFDQARREFEKASFELGDVISERHTLFNNLAVLDIYQKNDFEVIEDKLRQAMLTADGDFEKLVIQMNYLAIMDWQNRNTEAEQSISIINKIISQRTFASTEILLFAYFDIYKYFIDRNNQEKARYYLNEMKKIGIPDIPLWNHWLYKQPLEKSNELYYYGINNRAISFLCNWNMEYDSFLMHY